MKDIDERVLRDIVSGSIPWPGAEFTRVMEGHASLLHPLKPNSDAVSGALAAIDREYDDARVAESHKHRLLEMVRVFQRWASQMATSKPTHPAFYAGRAALLDQLLTESLEHEGEQKRRTYVSERVQDGLARALETLREQMLADLEEFRDDIDEFSGFRDSSGVVKEMERAVSEWRLRAAPLLSPLNRRMSRLDGDRPARAWLVEDVTRRGNYVLDWYVARYDSQGYFHTIGKSDFLDYSTQQQGWFGNWGDPFHRIIMIRGIEGILLSNRTDASLRKKLHGLFRRMRNEIQEAARQNGVEVYVSQTVEFPERRLWQAVEQHVPDTAEEDTRAGQDHMADILREVGQTPFPPPNARGLPRRRE